MVEGVWEEGKDDCELGPIQCLLHAVHRFSHSCSLMQQIFFFFFFGCATRHVGSQSPDQESNPVPPALEAWGVLTTGPGGMSQ